MVHRLAAALSARSIRSPIQTRAHSTNQVPGKDVPQYSWIFSIIHHELRRFHQMNHGYGAAAWVAS
jgi:hypothetical protein